jgi:hypothetical protein
MPDERNHTEEILDRIRTGTALSDSRGRRITLPDPQPAIAPKSTPQSLPSSYRRGGVVKKTGLAKVHKGEVILTKSKANALKLNSATKRNPQRPSCRRESNSRKNSGSIVVFPPENSPTLSPSRVARRGVARLRRRLTGSVYHI